MGKKHNPINSNPTVRTKRRELFIDESGFVAGSADIPEPWSPGRIRDVPNKKANSGSNGKVTSVPADVAPRATSNLPGETCDICQTRIQAGHLADHMALAHPPKVEPVQAPKPTPVTNNSRVQAASTTAASVPANPATDVSSPPRMPAERIQERTGKDPDNFVRDFSQYVRRQVSPNAIADWLDLLAQRGMPPTLANLAAIRAEETQRVLNASRTKIVSANKARQKPDAAKANPGRSAKSGRRPKTAKHGQKPEKKNKRKSRSVYTVSLNDTPGIAMVSASRKKSGGGWHR